MPKATLLSRETLTAHSLTSIVENSQNRKQPLAEYELRINSTQLDLVLTSKPHQFIKSISTDEGFESDIDTLSLVSSDDSFTSSTCMVEDHVLKHRENDSANGSASSDSDTEIVVALDQQSDSENYALADVLCYTDVKFPKVLVFVIKENVLVFNFDNVEHLQTFYTSFNTLKAVTNQRTYGRNIGAKFNLLQRTDNNGVTHIEISREPGTKLVLPESSEPSSIISINTPDLVKRSAIQGVKPLVNTFERKHQSQYQQISKEIKSQFGSQFRQVNNEKFGQISNEIKTQFGHNDVKHQFRNDVKSSTSQVTVNSQLLQNTIDAKYRQNEAKPELKLKSVDDSKVILQSERSSRSEFYPTTTVNSFTLKPKLSAENRSISREDILQDTPKPDTSLKKIWKSAEDLLDAPKRPERRRKLKGRAPPPPIDLAKQNVMKGQFVRVAVDPKKQVIEKFTRLEDPTPNLQTFSANVQTFTPNWNNIRQPQSPLVLTTSTKTPPRQYPKMTEAKRTDVVPSKTTQSWTNSVPRLLRKPRSRSESRNATPMAYRYIDTTKPTPSYNTNSQTISNRLFGLSQKLKEFGNNVVSTNNRNFNYYEAAQPEVRRNSIGEMTYKTGGTESSLKSVIKKQDDRKHKNGQEQKKVTFSAYATVQVV